MHSTQIQVEAKVEEDASLVVVQCNNKKTDHMEEDMVTPKVGGAKDGVVHGKGTIGQIATHSAIIVGIVDIKRRPL